MSGRNYGDLYSKNAEDLIVEFSVKQQLDFMIERLNELELDDISLASKILKVDYNKIEGILCKMQERINELKPIWQAVEKFDNSDTGMIELFESVQKYRKDNA